MYIVREVFQTKPGKAKELVRIFKNTRSDFLEMGAKEVRILTDFVANYWTVIMEFEVDEITDYLKMYEDKPESEKVGAKMKGYIDLVSGGHREMFKLE